MTTNATQYYAVIYHGGSLYGTGRWGQTPLCVCPITAMREGEKMAATCRAACGGSPTVTVYAYEF